MIVKVDPMFCLIKDKAEFYPARRGTIRNVLAQAYMLKKMVRGRHYITCDKNLRAKLSFLRIK